MVHGWRGACRAEARPCEADERGGALRSARRLPWVAVETERDAGRAPSVCMPEAGCVRWMAGECKVCRMELPLVISRYRGRWYDSVGCGRRSGRTSVFLRDVCFSAGAGRATRRDCAVILNYDTASFFYVDRYVFCAARRRYPFAHSLHPCNHLITACR